MHDPLNVKFLYSQFVHHREHNVPQFERTTECCVGICLFTVCCKSYMDHTNTLWAKCRVFVC